MEKRFVVTWENDEVTSMEIDGVRFTHIEDIPDDTDGARMTLLTSPSPEADLNYFTGKCRQSVLPVAAVSKTIQ